VAAEMRRVLSEFFLRNSLNDEKINTAFLSVTDVRVSSCLQHVKIYVTYLSDNVSEEECLEFLRLNTPHLRHCVGKQIRLKFVPDLLFFIDNSFDYAQKIECLLKEIQ
jgi:ribosome-binding factor A